MPSRFDAPLNTASDVPALLALAAEMPDARDASNAGMTTVLAARGISAALRALVIVTMEQNTLLSRIGQNQEERNVLLARGQERTEALQMEALRMSKTVFDQKFAIPGDDSALASVRRALADSEPAKK